MKMVLTKKSLKAPDRNKLANELCEAGHNGLACMYCDKPAMWKWGRSGYCEEHLPPYRDPRLSPAPKEKDEDEDAVWGRPSRPKTPNRTQAEFEEQTRRELAWAFEGHENDDWHSLGRAAKVEIVTRFAQAIERLRPKGLSIYELAAFTFQILQMEHYLDEMKRDLAQDG